MNLSTFSTPESVDSKVYISLRRNNATDLLRLLQYEQALIDNLTQQNTNFTIPNDLCGLPSFCTSCPNMTCYNKPLKECENCNVSAAYLLIVLYAALGIFIVAGNFLVIWNVARKRKGFGDTYSKVRASLAAADLLTGIQIFAVVIYNLNWTLHSSLSQLDWKQLTSINSLPATIGGVFYLLGFISSLYHLVYLALQRLYAIALPIRYKVRSHKYSVYFGLTVVWCLATVSSTFPLWFPNTLSFAYHHSIFLYFPTNVYADISSVDVIAIVSMVVLFVLPYLLMTSLSVATGIILFKHVRNRVTKLTASHSIRSTRNGISSNEMRVFKTVTSMQIGFTICLIPLIVVTSLFHAGYYSCDNFTVAYQVSFMLSMTNSLVNILVYLVFDSKYRESVLEIFGCCSMINSKSKAASSSNNQKTMFSKNTRSSSIFKSVELRYIKQLTK